ncbi:hypothetical protein GGS20DRAFT_554196 [Poronia punctata]|nr:hypothetical protein GGS20DRAFT_554196 [Poronia punctata]
MSKKTKSKHGTAPVIRKCGINETFQLAMFLLDQYRGTNLSCRYVIPPHLTSMDARTQLEQTVKVAVVDTILRHPMLQVGMIDAATKTPSWIQLQSLDLTRHIKWLYIGPPYDFEQSVQETFRLQLDDRFEDLPLEQPSWKITVLRKGDAPIMEVILSWNHPQFDGMAAKVFHEDFLEMLNNAENGAYERTGLDGDILTLPQEPPLLPTPIESLVRLPVDLKQLLKAFRDDVRPDFLNRDVTYASWCPIRGFPYKTQYRTFDMDNKSLVALLSLCRQNKTTITGLINALLLVSYSSHLDGKAAPAFQSSTVIDHRPNLPPAPPDAPWVRSDRAMANYVTQLPHIYGKSLVARIRSKLPTKGGELSDDLVHEVWVVSAQNRQQIVDKLKVPLRNDIVGIFKYVTDWQKTMKDMANKKRQFSWLVTNIGVLNGETSTKPHIAAAPPPIGGRGQRWSIERAQFGLSAEVFSGAIEFSPVSVTGGGFCVSANWSDSAVDEKFGDSIVHDLRRWLTQLANQP